MPVHRKGDPMSELFFAQLVDAIPLPAVLVGQEERFLGANAEARTVFGASLVGRHFATLLRQPPVIEAIETCLADRTPQTTRHLGNDGAQDTTFDVTCRHISGPQIPQGGVVLITFRDVSELEQASQMRRDFVANVSHELRTPLTALMGFIETLRGPARNDAGARDRFLEIMDGEAQRMNRLVGDLLSLNRVESEERVRPRETVDLCQQLESILTALQPVADKVATTLVLAPHDQTVEVLGDTDQLRQVFTNLIENAIKYGKPKGTVTIRLTLVDRDVSVRAAAVYVQIMDDGPGIDPVHLPRLTQRFYRADNHRSREMGGTGLGLAIVKHIINRHRGRLRVDSELGKGSCFTVVLPR